MKKHQCIKLHVRNYVRLLLTLILSSVLFACTSTPSGNGGDSFPESNLGYDNHLSLFETGISLPAEWFFSISKETVIEFQSPDGYFFGTVEWCESGKPLDPEDMVEFFERELLGSNKVIQAIGSDEKGILLFECHDPAANENFIAALKSQDRGFYLLEMTGPAGADTFSLSAAIADSVRWVPYRLARRRVKESFDFFSSDGTWKWAADTTDGALFIGSLEEDGLCVISVEETIENDQADLTLNSDEYSQVTLEFLINNSPEILEAQAAVIGKEIRVLFHLSAERLYRVSIRYQNGKQITEPDELAASDLVQSFFTSCIQFEGM